MTKKNAKAKFDIKSIGHGQLVGEIRDTEVKFYHEGEVASVDIRIKQLPYSKTEPLHRRLNDGDQKVISDWISLALVDEKGDTFLSPEQIDENFTQALANAVFEEVSGLKQLQEYVNKLGKESITEKSF